MKSYISLYLFLLILVACNNSGNEAFNGLDSKMNDGDSSNLDPVQISSFTPEVDPVILTNSTSAVFGVLVSGNVGEMTYDFILDEDYTTKLATGSNAFLNILGSNLTAGTHEIKVVATNGVTTDEKVFNVRKNSPPAILLSTPSFSGATMNCGSDVTKFTALLSDQDKDDSYQVTWLLDSVPVTPETEFVERVDLPSYAELQYQPDCTKSGSHTITIKITDGHDTTTANWNFTVNNPPPAPNQVQIVSWIPTTSPVIMTNASDTTFGVSVAEGSGTINYKFYLDNELSQDSGTSFFSLAGSSLMAGFHSLRVVASNGITEAEKSFNIRKNTPPAIITYSPIQNGNTVKCSDGSFVINVNYSDVNNDQVTAKWKLDETLVTPSTGFVTTEGTSSSAKLTYTPDCSVVGFHSFKIILNDGYEDFEQTWNVSVNNPPAPPGNVQILTFTPTTNPTVVTASTSTTFAVSIADGAGPVTYQFKRDDVEILQNSSDPFFIMSGSVLSAGPHSIRVRASNATSYDEKTFNVRRNSLPSYIVYSPELTGQKVNCGNSISFESTVIDTDPDTLTKSWQIDNIGVTNSTPGISIIDGANTGKLTYTSNCDNVGVHTVNIRTEDGYENSNLTWTFEVENPAQEAIGTTTPSGSNVVSLSTETSKTFTAIAATGIPPFTFKWYLKRAGQSDVLLKTEANVSSTSLLLNTVNDLQYGDQTIQVVLTDGSLANDPATPAERSWIVYKNQKPQITNQTPSAEKKINSNSTTALSAIITDSNDTFTTSISRGSTSCVPASSCGLTITSSPTVTGSYSANFTPGTSFIGDNTFNLSVVDSHGESTSVQFTLNANYFSDACNNLNAGEICTVSGMPGMGDELDVSLANNSTKVRVVPYKMSMHPVGLLKKNMFITDHANSVVWYWNRNNSSYQLGPYLIPANTVKIILGVAGYNTSMSYANPVNPAVITQTSFGNLSVNVLKDFFINGATGITNVVSGTTTDVYFAEYNQQRLLRLRFDSVSKTLNIQPSHQGTFNGCYPLDLAVDTAANKLYIPCSNGNNYIRVLDLAPNTAFKETSQSTSTTVTTSVGQIVNADGPVPATATTASVGSIYYDSVSDVLYFGETNSCKVRVLNPVGKTNTLSIFSTSTTPISVTPGNIKTISGGYTAVNPATWCYQARLGVFNDTSKTQFGNIRSVLPYRVNNGPLLGFFVNDLSYHRILFINQSSSTVTIGNRAVAANSVGIVFGLNNVAGSSNNNGTTAGGKSSPLYGPTDIAVDNGVLLVADNSNSRIRSLVINDGTNPITNGTVSTILGYIPRFGYNESPTLQADLVQYYSPGALKFDLKNNRLLISDRTNRRIRSLNLTTGVVDTIVGNGSNVYQTIQASPLSAGMLDPWDIEIVKQNGDEYPIYADFWSQDQGSFVKALNIYGNNATILGTEVEPGKLNNIAGTNSPPGVSSGSPYYTAYRWWGNPIGDYTTGNLVMYNDQPAVVVPIHGVRGLGYDEVSGSLYVSSYHDHCIHKIDSSGYITVQSGLCTQANNQSGSFANTRYRYPGDIEMDPLNPGNFFVIDQTDIGPSSLKYVNTYTGSGSSRNILGIPVPGNSIGNITLSTSPNFATAIAVNAYQLCIANGNGNFYATSSVICYSRTGSGSLSLYVGNRNNPTLGTTAFRGRAQKYNEDEGVGMGYFVDGDNIDPINIPVQLADPQGLAFDDEGNLFITETRGHTIRMVKRWYP